MRTALIPTFAIAALLALAGTALAQDCPECDEDPDDGGAVDNSYHSANVGVIEEQDRLLVDTDASHGHLREEKGFWSWLSLCFESFFGSIEEVLGVSLGTNANAELYASEDGVDLDATLYLAGERWDFDESEIGDLDGQTWELSKLTKPVRDEVDYPTHIPDYEGAIVDVCVYGEVHVGTCG